MSVSGSQNKGEYICLLHPPPVEADYTPKGTFKDIAGLKSYVVGPEDADKAVVFVYDIFGLTPQAKQGADLIASQGFYVVMPDFMKGEVAAPDMFSGTPEGNAKKEKFFAGFPGGISSQSKPVADVAAALSKYKLGGIGFCWGYKVLVTSEGSGSFKALAGAHPSFPANDDADKINVPLLLLPSQNEDMSVMKHIYAAVEKKNPGNNKLRQFADFPHGWMGARGNLSDPSGAKAFHDGYTEVAEFFKKHL
ncbi:hypothetical protein EHS25_004215 [Saitozyma podzolica]|uniref:Dienelactone hydrolase domain-containing protein n=1 Tax=Saitozyma podzolica TaxID=1890683 RepID=A0A427YTK6_9TREE|nr:hypothetical protein EHS25_004215 [Saitozyma podzolica]